MVESVLTQAPSRQDEMASVANPWASTQDDEASKQDNWLLSYIDLLTLLLTLFVVLLALQRQSEPVDVPLVAEKETVIQEAKETETAQIAKVEVVTQQVAESPIERKKVDLNPTEEPPFEEPQPVDIAQSSSTAIDPQPLIDVLKWNGLTDGVSISATKEQLRLETSDNILFDPASANLTDQGETVLSDLANVLRLHPGSISVEGHADNTPIIGGQYPSNWELSAARAARVVRFMVEQGVSSERLRAVGYSDTQPRADNETQAGRASNRRVSLVLDLTGKETKKQETTAEYRLD